MSKKSANKQSRRQLQRQFRPAYAAILLAFTVETAQANPMDATVVSGQASFATTGNTLTVVNTPGAIINWGSFSIGSGEITNFVQQSASSAVLNRVIGNDPSNILGTLQSNGRVFLVNPHGIVFGAGSVVDVAGLVASSLNLSDGDFLAGRNNFTEVPGAGNVSNAGHIKARNGGHVYLIAPNVESSGVITARNGEILLAAGASVELVNSNDPNLRVNITAPGGDVTNVGKLVASSGSLGLFGTVVRNSGVVSASSAMMQGGKIVFRASERVEAGGAISASGVGGGTINLLADMQSGTVNVSGTLDASAPVGGNGGFIETSAAHVQVADTARVTTAAANGNSGNWLIDPTDFYVSATDPANGSSWMSNTTLSSSLGSGNVTIQTLATGTGLGDIYVDGAVSWASANSLTLNAIRNVNINAAISNSGTGNLLARADLGGSSVGTIIFGAGGSVALSGGGRADLYYNPVSYTAPANYAANMGATPYTAWMLVNDVNQLQAINTNLAGNYALGANIDASATSGWNGVLGFAPLGVYTYFPNPWNYNPFVGQFDGLGHTISNLYINRSTENYVGLFGYVSGGSIRNVGLVNATVSGNISVGGLVGYNGGAINNSYISSGSVNGSRNVGGLVGYGTVSNSHYNVDGVLINGAYQVTSYGLYSSQYTDWLNNGLKLNIADYASLAGSGNNYTISTVQGMRDLLGFADNAAYIFTLGADIDLVNDAGLFIPYLAADFNGNNHVISNLSVSQSFNNTLGLFGRIASGTTVSNVVLKNAWVTGYSSVGGLAGWNQGTVSNSRVDNSNASGGSVVGFSDVGGLVGRNDGTISNSYINNSNSFNGGNVSGINNVGGLAGYNSGAISLSHVDNSNAYGGSVSGSNSVGGLVGKNFGNINMSYVSSGKVAGVSNVGGLAGYNNGTASWTGSGTVLSGGNITNSYVNNGTVVSGGSYVGGLVGLDGGEGAIKGNTVTDTTVNGTGSYVGGLAGRINSVFSNAGVYDSNHVVNSFVNGGTVLGNAFVGGLVGWNGVPITNSSVSGTAVTGLSDVGGLVGYNASSSTTGGVQIGGSITASYVSGGTVTGSSNVGGLVGNHNGIISNSRVIHVSGETVSGVSNVGGLAGYNNGSVSGSYASGGSIAGTSNVGGLAGYNAATGSYSNSFSSYSWGGRILNSYASNGTVSAASNSVGGLVGYNAGLISGSYVSGGSVTGSGINSGNIGGLAGINYGGTIELSSVRVVDVTGVSNVGGLVGKNGGSTLNGGTIAGAISSSYVSGGTVNATGINAGGLVGLNQYSIAGNFVRGVSVTGGSNVGGLVGQNIGGTGGKGLPGTSFTIGAQGATGTTTTVSSSYVSGGMVTGTGNNVGGLVGLNSVGAVGAPGTGINPGPGGFGGAAVISNSYVSGGTIAITTLASDVGGLVGNNAGSIDTSYVRGSSVSAACTDCGGGAGGLVGYNSGNISVSFASTGSVSGANFNGGLVGNNAGTISNTYASGVSVTGGTSGWSWIYVGGLAGNNTGTINTSYASSGTLSGGGSTGGVVGYNDFSGTLNSNFWDTTAAGVSVLNGVGYDFSALGGSDIGAIGMTDAEMKTMANFNSATVANGNVNPGWDISADGSGTVWRIAQGSTMPQLSYFPQAVTAPNIDELMSIIVQGTTTLDTENKPKPGELVVVDIGESTDPAMQSLPVCQ